MLQNRVVWWVYSSFPLIWSSTNMIFLAQKWTNFKLHQNDHPPKWSKLRTRGKLESFLMISSVLRQLFFRFVLCENNFYEDKNRKIWKHSLFLLWISQLCILYTLLLQKPVPGTVCKGISNAKHPIFSNLNVYFVCNFKLHQYDLSPKWSKRKFNSPKWSNE